MKDGTKDNKRGKKLCGICGGVGRVVVKVTAQPESNKENLVLGICQCRYGRDPAPGPIIAHVSITAEDDK